MKWTAPEALMDHIFTFRSDMYIAIDYLAAQLNGCMIADFFITTAGLLVLSCGRSSPMVSCLFIAYDILILSE